MEYTDLHGVRVSRIGLGTWAIGGSEWGVVEEHDAVAACRSIFDHGINLIDTAPIYGAGRAEKIFGKAIAEHGRREDFYIATKAGLRRVGEDVVADARRASVLEEVEQSLRRLGTDYVDLYQLHWPDTQTPIEETAEVFLQLYEAGKIRAVGVSNCSAEEMERFRAVAPLHANQPPMNIFEREAEQNTLPYCRRHGIGVLAYSALCRSLLAGRIRAGQTFPADDIRSVDPKFQPPRLAQYVQAVQALDAYAQQHYGKRVLHLALRWLLDQPGVSVALWGAKNIEQLAPTEAISGWKLTQEDMHAIDAIVADAVRDPVGPEYLRPSVRPL
ncbi:MAG TPA: aldo/keto reductase [Acidobacteriaceae bacterium]|jgi:aryl-alcohol dehydrogenase-like predicted oxidoreductase|nr:aldo/keto reductase [Acidobacteriaceae bacterium]